ILLEEYRKTRTEFACAGLGDEIGVVRGRGLVEEETWWILRNAPGVKAEKEDESSDPQQKSQSFLIYTGSASGDRPVIRHSVRLPGRQRDDRYSRGTSTQNKKFVCCQRDCRRLVQFVWRRRR